MPSFPVGRDPDEIQRLADANLRLGVVSLLFDLLRAGNSRPRGRSFAQLVVSMFLHRGLVLGGLSAALAAQVVLAWLLMRRAEP